MVNDRLAAYLADVAGREIDSLAFLAEWVALATGRAPPLPSGMGEPELAKCARTLLRQLGFKRTRSPIAGDIGLVSLSKGHLVGAIFSGTHWCLPAVPPLPGIGALVPSRFRFVAAWGLPSCGRDFAGLSKSRGSS